MDAMGLLSNPLFNAGMGLLSANTRSTTPPNYAQSVMQSLMMGQQMKQQAEESQAMREFRQMQMAQMQAAQAQQQQEAAAMEAAIAGLPPEQQAMARANPTAFIKPPEVVSPTDDQREYAAAVEQGYPGTLQDWIISQKQAGASRTDVSVNTKDMVSKYYDTEIAAFSEAEKAAQSAYSANKALDRFVAASATGDAGGAEPIMTATKNFLSSFGFEFDSLKDVASMESAVNQILGAKMAELGARGLTDKDMQILVAMLPQVETSREARETVAEIVRRSNESVIQDYEFLRTQRDSMFPDHKFMTPRWLNEYKTQKNMKPPEGVDPALWTEMEPEERALWQK